MQASQLRAFSPTSGPFHLGMLAGAAVIAGLVMSRASDRRWIVPTAIAATTLALTITRAIWIGAVVGSVVAVAALLISERKERRPSLEQRGPLSEWRYAARAGVCDRGAARRRRSVRDRNPTGRSLDGVHPVLCHRSEEPVAPVRVLVVVRGADPAKPLDWVRHQCS